MVEKKKILTVTVDIGAIPERDAAVSGIGQSLQSLIEISFTVECADAWVVSDQPSVVLANVAQSSTYPWYRNQLR